MTIVDEIAALETRAKSQAIGIAAIMNRADLDLSSWYRWRRGEHSPSLENWRDVEAALAALIAERDAALPIKSEGDLDIPAKGDAA